MNSVGLGCLCLAVLAAFGCAKSGAALPSAALDHAIGASVGDPTTCVLIARAGERRAVYRYGQLFN
ncbi:MAG: hypothetical protein ABI376_09760, partial [Caulobacteraceae bacterium]